MNSPAQHTQYTHTTHNTLTSARTTNQPAVAIVPLGQLVRRLPVKYTATYITHHSTASYSYSTHYLIAPHQLLPTSEHSVSASHIESRRIAATFPIDLYSLGTLVTAPFEAYSSTSRLISCPQPRLFHVVVVITVKPCLSLRPLHPFFLLHLPFVP